MAEEVKGPKHAVRIAGGFLAVYHWLAKPMAQLLGFEPDDD